MISAASLKSGGNVEHENSSTSSCESLARPIRNGCSSNINVSSPISRFVITPRILQLRPFTRGDRLIHNDRQEEMLNAPDSHFLPAAETRLFRLPVRDQFHLASHGSKREQHRSERD